MGRPMTESKALWENDLEPTTPLGEGPNRVPTGTQPANNELLTPSKCITCDMPEGLEKHRIIPGRIGGKYAAENVILLCKRCHMLGHRLARLMKKQHGFVE